MQREKIKSMAMRTRAAIMPIGGKTGRQLSQKNFNIEGKDLFTGQVFFHFYANSECLFPAYLQIYGDFY